MWPFDGLWDSIRRFFDNLRSTPDGSMTLKNAAVYLVKTYSDQFEDEYFENTTEFPNGHVISKDEAAYYEALHILSCLATDREICFYNLNVTQQWVDAAVEAYFEEFDPIPRNAYPGRKANNASPDKE